MKFKDLLTAFALLFLACETKAQTFRAGFTTGLVATEVNGATRSGHFHKAGVSLGLLVNTHINKKNIFQMELNYVQKGSFYRGDSLGNGRFRIALNYVEIPFLVRHKIHFLKRGKPVNRVDLEFGGSYGRMVSHRAVDGQNTILPPSNYLYNYNDISLLAGFDINITPKFIFCFRYSNSIIPSIKRNSPNLYFITYTFNRGNNMVMLFSLKFIFGNNPEAPLSNNVPDTKPDDQ